MKRRAFSVLILIALLVLAACDSNNAPTATPQGNVGGPTFPPVVATGEAPVSTGVVPLSTGGVPVDTPVTAPPTVTATSGVGMVLSGFQAGVTRLAWSPDGALLAASTGGFGGRDVGADSYVVWVWNAQGEPVGQWKGHTGGVLTIQWSPDSQTLASGGSDGNVVLWSRDGTPKATLQINAGTVFSLDWASNGDKLAVGAVKGTSDNTAEIWSSSGTLEKTLHTKYSGGKFYNVGWSPDAKYLFGGATDYALWDAAGNVITSTYATAGSTPSWGSAWSPDSKVWAYGNESGYVDLVDTSGTSIGYIQAQTSVNNMAWSPDGGTIALANELWRPDGSQIGTLRGFRSTVTSLDWSPDGKMIAAGASGIANSGVLGIFDSKGVEVYKAENSDGQVNYVAWSPDGKTLAVAYENKTVRLLHVENGTVR